MGHKKNNMMGYDLLHQGVLALADVERNGIKVDTKYLTKTIASMGESIKKKTKKLKDSKVWRIWHRSRGEKAKLGSREQLADVLYNKMGFPITSRTETGKPAADEEALARIDHPFVKNWVALDRERDAKTKYLEAIFRYMKNGRLHANFNLHTAQTFRSSSSKPNFQNMPIRNEWYAELIRRCFIADSDDYVLVEIDYGQVEVRVAACYNHDPKLIEYVTGKGDMHHDLCMQLYFLRDEQVSKPARHCAKNMFVFPQFYGDYYRKCAAQLYNSIWTMDLRTKDKNIPLHKILKKRGITELSTGEDRPAKGTYEYHVKEVENHFWNTRFPVYTEWKNSWYESYLKTGGFKTLTGFEINGVLRKNQVINFPIQGSAFHCLLWSLIHINKWLTAKQMWSKIVGQIHDSILMCVHRKELQDVLSKCKYIMTDKLRKAWDWIIVPLVVEADVTPPGGSWHAKKPYPI